MAPYLAVKRKIVQDLAVIRYFVVTEILALPHNLLQDVGRYKFTDLN
jgi:hypothetical protein